MFGQTVTGYLLTIARRLRTGRRPSRFTPEPPAGRDSPGAFSGSTTTRQGLLGLFIQTYEGGALRRKATEGGTVYIKKPGKMRWDYTAPEKKLFISDGRTIFLLPADKQVMKNPVPDRTRPRAPCCF